MHNNRSCRYGQPEHLRASVATHCLSRLIHYPEELLPRCDHVSTSSIQHYPFVGRNPTDTSQQDTVTIWSVSSTKRHTNSLRCQLTKTSPAVPSKSLECFARNLGRCDICTTFSGLLRLWTICRPLQWKDCCGLSRGHSQAYQRHQDCMYCS